MLQFMPVDSGARPAVPTTASAPQAVIYIAVSLGQTQLNVWWPASHAAACGLWLHDLLAVSR